MMFIKLEPDVVPDSVVIKRLALSLEFEACSAL